MSHRTTSLILRAISDLAQRYKLKPTITLQISVAPEHTAIKIRYVLEVRSTLAASECASFVFVSRRGINARAV